MTQPFDFQASLRHAAPAGVRPQHRVDLAPAGGAGRPAHAAAGGNAVDAAIAAAAVMTMVEPCSNGLGSDSFCILWDGQRLHGLNASGRAPAAWTPQYFRDQHGGGADAAGARLGLGHRARRGGVWVALSQRFGKLPFADLLAPAIDIAERGYAVPVVVQHKWAAARSR